MHTGQLDFKYMQHADKPRLLGQLEPPIIPFLLLCRHRDRMNRASRASGRSEWVGFGMGSATEETREEALAAACLPDVGQSNCGFMGLSSPLGR